MASGWDGDVPDTELPEKVLPGGTRSIRRGPFAEPSPAAVPHGRKSVHCPGDAVGCISGQRLLAAPLRIAVRAAARSDATDGIAEEPM